MKAFLGSCYYCKKCDKPYNNKNKPRCNTHRDVCKLCAKSYYSEEEENKIYWENCNRYCFNQNCFNNHNNVCKKVYKRKNCNKILLRSRKHTCGYSLCRNCNNIDKTNEHKCFMPPKVPKAYTEKYIWFDYEAEQDTGVHKEKLNCSPLFLRYKILVRI